MTRFEELCLQLATNIVAVYRACTQNQLLKRKFEGEIIHVFMVQDYQIGIAFWIRCLKTCVVPCRHSYILRPRTLQYLCTTSVYIYTVTRCDPLQSYTLSASALVVKELEKCTQITVAQVQDPRGEFVPHNEARTSSHNCSDCQVTLSKVSRISLVKGAN